MPRERNFTLGDRVVGTLLRLDQGRLRFGDEESYRTSPDATPPSASMPTQVASHSDQVTTPRP